MKTTTLIQGWNQTGGVSAVPAAHADLFLLNTVHLGNQQEYISLQVHL